MLYTNTNFEEKFSNPPSEYRGAPFWAWNTDVEASVLKEQIKVFKEMGFGGFHIHSRIGLNTPYLGEKFMEMVRYCNQVGKENEMLTWLYDEDKWPSGFGGGLVTQNEEFRIRYLLFSPALHEDGPFKRDVPATSRVNIDGNITYLCSYKVVLKDGLLVSYGSSKKRDIANENESVWHAYRVVSGDSSWFNNQAYVDTLNPKAIEKFIEVTHEVYAKHLQDEFGKSVPAMFTDEPQYFKMQNFIRSEDAKEIGIPFTDNLDEDYVSRYGVSLFESLPEIFWELEKGKVSPVRYRYFDILTERFVDAYAKTLDTWCSKHSLLSTGHLMGESTLDLQTRLCGEAMRSYKNFQLPGIDMLANRYEYATAKQAQSACHQYGAPGVLSELYGVTNWSFDFRDHKLQGDWQAALGVTVRVHHLSWVTMAGEAKRDYPAPIDQHSPWYQEYKSIEDHFARVNVAMTRGKSIVKIGVLHPIESNWVAFGPDDKTAQTRKKLETQFENLTEWLLFGLLDFDYISESQLPELYVGFENQACKVGKSKYEVIVVPELITIRKTTLDILNSFVEAGGRVVFLGAVPRLVDAVADSYASSVAAKCDQIGFNQWELISTLDPFREVELLENNYHRRSDLIYQMRQDGDERWLFIAHGRQKNKLQMQNFRDEIDFTVTIRIRGEYDVVKYDTFTGTHVRMVAEIKDGWTVCSAPLYSHDSLLLRLVSPVSKPMGVKGVNKSQNLIETVRLYKPSSYTLEEQNVLLLDQAEYSVDGGEWQPSEEILLIDDSVRRTFGFPMRSEAFPQPWLIVQDTARSHIISLRYYIDSVVDDTFVKLACETPDAIIYWNGELISTVLNEEYFVDACLPVIPIGLVRKGRNILQLQIPFGKKTNLEWCYLLGDFGVRMEVGRNVVTSKSENLFFGDITRQSLPFYGGNIIYSLPVTAQKGRWVLKVPHYVGSLLTVSLDGKKIGQIIGEPYMIDLGEVDDKEHELQIKFFGNRINTFGQIHNSNPDEAYFGPKSWRSKDENWTYSYRVRPVGVLSEPLLYIYR